MTTLEKIVVSFSDARQGYTIVKKNVSSYELKYFVV